MQQSRQQTTSNRINMDRISTALRGLLLAATAVLGLGSATALAQETYPARTVRLISASAGSPQDLVGRLLGQRLSELWGQPVVVENKAGAGALLSITSMIKAPADGYTMLVTSSSVAVLPGLMPNAGYDADKDLTPVILVASSPNLLITHAGGPASLQEAISRARAADTAAASGGRFNYGSPGSGTTPQLTAEYLLRTLAGTKATHVPYKGIPPVLAAAVSGEVDIASVALPAAAGLVKSGKLRGLAVTSARRVAAMPDVPTIAEAGFSNFEDTTWVGLMLPANAPVALVNRIHADVEKLLATPDMRSRLAAIGFEPMGGTPQQFAAYLRQEIGKWNKVIKATGARLE